jgi:chitin disaccharide deacetylase
MAMTSLIVTGDDFGISHGINRGIIQAHSTGILTSTSLMVDRAAATEAAVLARRYPTLSLGLHLELDAVEPQRVPAELDRQLARFLELVGSPPTHIDSHHDAHRAGLVLHSVLAFAQRFGVPVRGYSRVHHVSKFYGRWGGEPHLDQVSPAGFVRVLDEEVRAGVNELSCHPGHVDGELRSSYGTEREVELATLCDGAARRAIQDRHIRLIGFRDLPARATSTFAEDVAS